MAKKIIKKIQFKKRTGFSSMHEKTQMLRKHFTLNSKTLKITKGLIFIRFEVLVYKFQYWL